MQKAAKVITDKNLTAYVYNKRESFDAMRSYQTSELSHKTDAISMMRTIFTVSIGIFAALYGALIDSSYEVVGKNLITIALPVANFVAIYIIYKSTKNKIKKSHNRYAEHGKEYENFTKLLGLDKTLEVSGLHVEGKILQPGKPIGSGNGYKHSIKIIRDWGISLSLAIIALAIAISLIQPTGNNEDQVDYEEIKVHLSRVEQELKLINSTMQMNMITEKGYIEELALHNSMHLDRHLKLVQYAIKSNNRKNANK